MKVKLGSSLRTRLLSVVLVAVLPPLGLLGFMGLQTRSMAADNTLAEAMRLGRVASAAHEKIISSVHQLLTILSVLPEIREPNSAGCQNLLATLRASQPFIANIGVIDLNGDIICSGLPMTSPINAADRSYFQRAVETGDFAAGEYQLGRITGVYSLNFGYPVRDDTGKIQSVVFAAVDLSWLNRLADEVELPTGSTLTVFDRNGTVLARRPGGAGWTGQSVPRTPLMQWIATHEGSGTAQVQDLDQRQRLFAFTSLGGAGQGVVLAVGFSTEVAYARANRAVASLLIGAGFITILALLTAWFGSEAFALRRLHLILHATERLATGDLAARVGPPYGPAELGMLSMAFDELALKLETRSADWERSKAEMARLKRASQAASDWLRLLVARRPAAEALQQACELAVSRRGYSAAWVCKLDGAGEHATIEAAAGLEDDSLAALRRMLTEGASSAAGNPLLDLIKTSPPRVLRDLNESAQREAWILELANTDCACLVVLPLRTDGDAVGSLILCDRSPDAFGKDEVDVLSGGVRAIGSLIPLNPDDTDD